MRFRSLGDYPLSAAIESSAATLDAIIEEMLAARTSERSGRLIDSGRGGLDGTQEARGVLLMDVPAEKSLLRFLTCGSVG